MVSSDPAGLTDLPSFLSSLAHLLPDDADAGEIKKSHKSVRRRQREAANNQKQEEASKRQWEAHRTSVSSHSSGDEVQLHYFLVIHSKILTVLCHFNVSSPSYRGRSQL